MRVQSLYNAGLLIEADDVRLLCDPWFTDGAYQGAWAIWPRPLENTVEDIGKVNAIYISHVHPDHYDKTFLRQYLQRWGETPIICGLQSLTDALRADGFSSARQLNKYFGINNVAMRIVPNTLRQTLIDTALAVRCGTGTLVNLNDNPYDQKQIEQLLEFCGGSPTVAYLPFTGASSYPQRFQFDSQDALLKAAEDKKQVGLQRFLAYVERLHPTYVVPFAGEYWLQGPLQKYNALRGQADATEAVALCKQAILPAGRSWFDVTTGQASAVRMVPYDAAEAMRVINGRGFSGYEYEKDYPFWEHMNVDMRHIKDTAMLDTYRRNHGKLFLPDMEMDERYLFGLLTGRYHWNDALISSHVYYKQNPPAEVFELLEEWHL